jgi:hypothetical protein
MGATQLYVGAAMNGTGEKKAPSERSILKVVLGDIHFPTWYSSFYSEDLLGTEKKDTLYICRYCFKYTNEIVPHLAHMVRPHTIDCSDR